MLKELKSTNKCKNKIVGLTYQNIMIFNNIKYFRTFIGLK